MPARTRSVGDVVLAITLAAQVNQQVSAAVSLLNDAASEMITPLLPVFLTATLGAGPAIVGLVEGVAEATASILKLVAGRLVDRGAGAKRLVVAGYGLANLARPALGLAAPASAAYSNRCKPDR